MKNIFLLLFSILAFNAFSQTVGGKPGSQIDSTTNPSDQAFGGALGGGPTTVPSTTNHANSPTSNVPRGNQFFEPERMESPGLTDSDSDGTEETPSTTVPRVLSYPDTPVAPSVPPTGAELPRSQGPTLAPQGNGVGNGGRPGTP
jgi:hypothetical protein